VGTVFGQEVLERVARHLPTEAPQLGRHRHDTVVDEPVEPRDDGVEAARGCAGAQPAAGPVEDVELDHVGGGRAVGHGVGPAGVVPDHAAEGAAGVGRRVRAETQAVGSGRRLQIVEDHAGLDRGRRGRRIEGGDASEMAAQIGDDAGTDGVAGDRRAPAADGQRRPEVTADRRDGQELVDMPGKGHDLWHHPVVGGVRAVLGAAARGRVGPGTELFPQAREELGGRDGDRG
jgi:hypothetical protein